jgi:hypothetical protein
LLDVRRRVTFPVMRRLHALFAAALAASACDDPGGTDGGGAPSDSGIDVDPADGGGIDTGPRDSSVEDAGRRDVGVEEAVTVEVGDPYGAEGVIDPAGDLDLFRFEAAAGQWLRIITRTGGSPVDPVITLFDEALNRLAENDDQVDVVRRGTDSEINFYVPEAGTYFVGVQEYATWAEETPVGGPDYVYSLRVLIWNDVIQGVLIDPENGDDAPSAAPGELGTLLGTFRDASDVDVFRIRIDTATTARYEVLVLPSGPEGQGSTSPVGDLWLTDATGDEILARVNNAAGSQTLEPPVNPGEYLLFLAHPETAAGGNDYYVLRSDLFVENDRERGEPTNDFAAGAEPMSMIADGNARAWFLLARLPENDVDYFLFDMMPGEQLSVACGAESRGSGVRGLTVEVRDRNDAIVKSTAEIPADGVSIEAFVPTSTGAHSIRLSAGMPESEVTSRFVRCGLRAGPPPP